MARTKTNVKTKQRSVHLPEEDNNFLEQIAALLGTKGPNLVRMLVHQRLDHVRDHQQTTGNLNPKLFLE